MGKMDLNDDDFRVMEVRATAEQIGEMLLGKFDHDASGFANIFTTITLVAQAMSMTSALAALLHRDDVTDEEIEDATKGCLRELGKNISDVDNMAIDMKGSIHSTRAMVKRKFDDLAKRWGVDSVSLN